MSVLVNIMEVLVVSWLSSLSMKSTRERCFVYVEFELTYGSNPRVLLYQVSDQDLG